MSSGLFSFFAHRQIECLTQVIITPGIFFGQRFVLVEYPLNIDRTVLRDAEVVTEQSDCQAYLGFSVHEYDLVHSNSREAIVPNGIGHVH